MKKFKLLLSAALALSAVAAVSCNKEKIAPAPQPERGKINVSVRGMLGEYSQEEDTKAALVNNLRVKWAADDIVYAFDGAKCLGGLVVSLKDGKDYYAVLSGELDEPQEGTSKITLVYATAFSKAKGAAVTDLEIDLASQTASDSPEKAPFVAFGFLDYESYTPEIENQIVDFSLATSVLRLNCSGLEPGVAITAAKFTGASNKSILKITKDGAGIGEGNTGEIDFDCTGFSASDKGTKVLYVSVAPKTTALAKQVLKLTQTEDYSYVLGTKSRAAAKSYNVICPMTLATKAGSIADVNQALKEGKTSIQIEDPTDFGNAITFPKASGETKGVDGKDVYIKVTGMPADATLNFVNEAGAQGPANLFIESDAASNDKLVINTPNTHVDIVNGTYNSVEATTSATTLVVEKDVMIADLTLKKGGADIYGNVTNISEVKEGASVRYFVSAADQLCEIASETVADTFKGTEVHLVDNIDLNDKQFTPIIMKADGRFTLFDGGGHTVSNMSIVDSGKDYSALIGFMAGGVVKDVTVKGATIEYSASVGDYARGAAIVGIVYGGTIENCHAENVSITGYRKMGGIAGYLAQSGNGVVVRNCSARNITFTNNTEDLTYQAGGLIGYILNYDGDILVEGCSVSNITINNLYDGSEGENLGYYCGTFIGSLDNQAEKEGLKVELKSNTISGTNTPQISHIYADEYFGWANNPENTSKDKKPYLATITINGQVWTPDYPFVIPETGKKYSILNKALAAATEGQTVQILKAGDYATNNLSTKAAVVEATVDGVVFNHPTAATSWVASCQGTTIKNITWNVGTAHRQFISNTNLENCTVNGLLCTHIINKFKDCTFINEDGYNFWAYGNEYTEFDNCTFTCPGKNDGAAGCGGAINCYNEGAQTPTPIIVIKNCTFTAKMASDKYSALYIKPETAFDIRISNTTCNDKFCTGAISGSKLWNLTSDREGTTVSIDGNMVYPFCSKDADGNYHIINAAGLLQFHDLYAAGKVAHTAKVYIENDIDFTGKTWNACEWHADKTTKGFALFDGQNHTIKNFTVNGQGMFSMWACTANIGATPYFKDIVFDGAKNTTSTLNVSILCGHCYQSAKIENVTIKNSQIEGTYEVAPFVGSVYDENGRGPILTLKDCKVENTTIKGTSYDKDICGMVAWVNESNNDKITFEGDNVVKDVTLYIPKVSYGMCAKIYHNGETAYDEAANVTVNNVNVVIAQ